MIDYKLILKSQITKNTTKNKMGVGSNNTQTISCIQKNKKAKKVSKTKFGAKRKKKI